MNRTAILKASLDILFYSGTSRSLRKVLGGRGAIFMLHHVRPGGGMQHGFAPNSGLEITPEFLEAVIQRATELGYELISLDECVYRLRSNQLGSQPFAVFTMDDGYTDNLQYALPVFQRHNCPFTIFVAPSITDGVCELWWRGLESAIAKSDRLKVNLDGKLLDLSTRSPSEKQHAFERIYWPLRGMPEHGQRAWIRRLAAEHGVDLYAQCRSSAMPWDDIREISGNPLCTIGAHTLNHFAVAKLAPEEAAHEAISSRERIEKELGKPVQLFAYPYGDGSSAGPRDFAIIKEAGFSAAVTTRKGLVVDAHRDQLTALPRVALNGSFQKLRYLDVLLSGTAFAIWNVFRLE